MQTADFYQILDAELTEIVAEEKDNAYIQIQSSQQSEVLCPTHLVLEVLWQSLVSFGLSAIHYR